MKLLATPPPIREYCGHTMGGAEKDERGAGTWAWLAPMYFVEGMPNVLATSVSVVFFKSMGLSNAASAALASSLALPWIAKPLWAPLIDSFSTRRKWALGSLLALTVSFFALAASPFAGAWASAAVACLWAAGFASATYDAASDGFYMLALSDRGQAFFVGIRNTFYRVAMVFAQGGVVWAAGRAGAAFGSPGAGWGAAFGICAALCAASFAVLFFALPRPPGDVPRRTAGASSLARGFIRIFSEFFSRRGIFAILAYILLYRFAEGQLAKVVQIFLIDSRADGGLGLSLEEAGYVYACSPVALLAGGVLGGVYISRRGLEGSLMPMACAMNLPNVIYVILAWIQPQSASAAALGVFCEQFGYGFGFAGYMMFLIHSSRGEYRTSFYAICTGLMALGLNVPGFFSGLAQSAVGYFGFFVWVLLSTAVSFAVTLGAVRVVASDARGGGFAA